MIYVGERCVAHRSGCFPATKSVASHLPARGDGSSSANGRAALARREPRLSSSRLFQLTRHVWEEYRVRP